MLLASEAGDFVELILLYFHIHSDFPFLSRRIARRCTAVGQSSVQTESLSKEKKIIVSGRGQSCASFGRGDLGVFF